MDLSKYAELFVTESREHLSALNESLLELERSPTAAEPVGAIFRAVHTVKGMSATMGYRAVSELAHEMESVLDHVRKGTLAVTRDVVDLLFAAADALEEAIERSARGEDDAVDVREMIAKLHAAAGGATARSEPGRRGVSGARGARRRAESRPSAPPAESPPDESSAGRLVRVRLSPETVLRGARAFVVVRRAEALGRVLEVDPPLAALQAEQFERDFSIRLESDADAERIAATLRAAGDVESVEVEGAAPASPPAPDRARPDEPRAPEERAPRGGGPELARRSAQFVRIDLRRLDTLMNLIGELVIARGRLTQIAGGLADPTLDETVAQASRLIGDLQEEIMRSRMVPVGQVFDRFPRLVRDTARAVGKEVSFSIQGKEIELDRSMLEEIGEPVMHLLRNAIDHGIEPPDVRVAAGKPREGHLTLSIARERSTVTVRVTDDGRGIDRTRVLQKAHEMGLVPPAATALSDDELVRLIGRPGFSTAERVTDLSGRGVGIDVVNTRVRSLGGSVEIRSAAGEGTTVTTRLPVTLAIVRALLARVADETYAVPLTHVSETVELAASARKQLKGRDVLLMRDDVLPLIEFRDLLHLPKAPAEPHQVIVLESGERRAALVVDELTGQQEIVVKTFDPVRDGLALFSGATILADGAPALIVDVASLL